MFIFTDFVRSQLKESFEHYKPLKAAKRKKKESTDIMQQTKISNI